MKKQGAVRTKAKNPTIAEALEYVSSSFKEQLSELNDLAEAQTLLKAARCASKLKLIRARIQLLNYKSHHGVD